MTNSAKVSVALLNKKDLVMFSDCVNNVISNTHYYNRSARDEELQTYKIINLKKMIKDPKMVVFSAKVDNKIAGFGFAKFDSRMIHFLWIGIAINYRRMGIGTKLHKFIYSYAKKCVPKIHKIWGDTRTNNIQSINLLKKMGFVKIATLINHWYRQDYFLWERLL